MKSLVPHMDLPLHIKIPMLILMFPIEVVGLLIRHAVLAVRLLANMMAGHIGLAVIVAFIAVSAIHLVVGRDAGQRAGGHGAQLARAVRRISACLHFYVFVGLVHWHGRSPALVQWVRIRLIQLVHDISRRLRSEKCSSIWCHRLGRIAAGFARISSTSGSWCSSGGASR